MTAKEIVIAGGGIAGLAAALGLARIGRRAVLVEQAPAFEEVGAGLQMAPNGVAALRWLGAWEQVEPTCVIPTEIHVRDSRSGGLLQRVRLGKPFEERFGAPYRVCHRADLLGGLARTTGEAAGIELRTGTRIAKAETSADGASLILADGSRLEGAAVIGADGIRSTVREAVCGPVKPRFRGHAIYRALLPLNRVPPAIEADCVTLWLCPGGHVVHYPVSNWRNFNIVVTIDSAAPPNDWSTMSDGSEFRAALANGSDVLDSLLAAPLSWLCWPGSDLPALPHWSKGHIVLTGDAAHATLPYLAQGAVMAMEDATVLATTLAAAGDPAAAFAAFAEARRPRTQRIQEESRHLASVYHAHGLKAFARNQVMALMRSEGLAARYAWIYEWRPPGPSAA